VSSRLAGLLVGLFVLATLAALAATSAQEVRKAEAAHPPVGQFVSAGGVRLHYVERGAGRPVVLIHDTDGILQEFTLSVFDRVAANHRALAFDRPGHGYSERPPGQPLDLALNARLLRAALSALGVEQPILLGQAYGASIALQYAADYPGEAAGLILLAPAAYAPGGLPNPIYLLPSTPLLGPLLLQTLLVPLGRLVLPGVQEAAFSPLPVPTQYQDVTTALSLRPAQFQAHAEEVRAFGPDLRALAPRYAALPLPIAILAGEADLIAPPPTQAEPLHRALPAARLEILPETGHQIHFQQPEAVVRAIESLP
jgi:pimeloyl-ACP methyl ester carboxylesterase